MNSQRHIHILRVQLLAMSRLSQRALDYSIKGYELRNLDFARHVRTADREVEEHYRRIKDLSRELMNGGIARSADSRFAFAAFHIGTALHVTYTAAASIAQNTVRLLEGSGIQRSAALERIGHLVNESLRLSIVALFNSHAGYAQTLLGNQEAVRELVSADVHPHVDRVAGTQDAFEGAVIRSLGEVAKQVHEIADAILFWLEGKTRAEASAIDKYSSLELRTARHQGDAAALSYMRSKRRQTPKTAQGLPC
jgi:phosphate uptake regulator